MNAEEVEQFEADNAYPMTLAERALAVLLAVSPFAAAAVAFALVGGCASDRVKSVELEGMFAQTESGTLAIGNIDVMASPNGQESAIIKYEEDTAWLSPSTKTHGIKILLGGTNSVEKVDLIVGHICRAFIPAAAIVNGAEMTPPPVATNAVRIVEGVE